MKFPYYKGDGKKRFEEAVTLPVSQRARYQNPADYLAGPDLVDAVNVALLLGQPLLLTGEPGTGKTQLAYSLAWELGFDEPEKFEVKSTHVARDLFYTYDALGRFQAAQSGAQEGSVLDYLTFNAFGVAILRAKTESEVACYLPPGFEHGGQRRSVVLIDEIDKAPRDFPNDLLNELEGMYFRVPELDNLEIAADPALQPIVVITSNSEKDLPDAFLRRCIFYNIRFPDRATLERIVASRLGEYAGGSDDFLRDALDLFFELRKASNSMRKQPATAELLGWLASMREIGGGGENPLAARPDLARSTLSNLVKTAEDRSTALRLVDRWIEERNI